MYCVQPKLKHLNLHLKHWNKNEFSNIFQDQKEIYEKMEDIHLQMIQSGRSPTLEE